ncbi:hypothetical protein [Reyranella sp.]|uniref:hypothetical protein n=1 Tax=Reyranella sp. TaxID=1929291 RepID=UPI003D0F86CD
MEAQADEQSDAAAHPVPSRGQSMMSSKRKAGAASIGPSRSVITKVIFRSASHVDADRIIGTRSRFLLFKPLVSLAAVDSVDAPRSPAD